MKTNPSERMGLRGYQVEAFNAITKGFGEFQKQLAVKPTGCHAPGSPILMADGSLRAVETIRVGEQVMGPDSQPRTVMELHCGSDDMFEIKPDRGDPFVVNGGHILRLRRTRTGEGQADRAPWFCEISVADFICTGSQFRETHLLERVAVEFPKAQALQFDAYSLGAILGLPASSAHRVEVLADDTLCVPDIYCRAEKSVRTQVLAGVLDVGGIPIVGGFEFTSRSAGLAEDIAFIAGSLGLAADRAVIVEGVDMFHRVRISGDFSRLPMQILPTPDGGNSHMLAGFAVRPVGRGEYFGFTIDGDHLYLDGSFTVHHNSGKTILFAKLAEHYQPRRTLVLAHREELISQAVDKIRKATGLVADVEMGSSRASLDAPVVVASVQTLMRENRRERFPRDHFGLVVVDEAHHVLANSYLSVMNHYDEYAFVLGVSATPDRGDKKNLGRYFQNIAYEISLLDLIKQQWLSPIRVKTVPLGLDLSGVRTTAGDFNPDDLAHAIEPYLGRIADVMVENRDRKTLVFLPLISLSERFAAMCSERGLNAEHVDGQSRDRAGILARFSRNETRILSNAMLLTEGYDEPSIDCVVCLRPTKVRALYSQIVGRGTRLFPGKDHLLLLDFLWLSGDHSLVKPAHLIAGSAEEAAQITENIGDEGDLEEAKEAADRDLAANLRRRLKENCHRQSRTFDALEFALSINDMDLADYVPTMAWHDHSVTPKQAELLARYGVDPATVSCKGQASAIINKVFMRFDLGLATPKQVRMLRRFGHAQPALATFNEAKAFLDIHLGGRKAVLA